MKTIAVAALMILASASALPQFSDLEQRRDPVEVVLDVIERAKAFIVERGYDPIEIERLEGTYELPIPGIFTATGYIQDLRVTGLSNIVVNDIRQAAYSNNLILDIALPEVRASIGAAEGEIKILGRPARRGLLDGELAIVNLRILAEANFNVDDSGVSVTELSVSASLGGIKSGIHLNLFGYDLSAYVNNFLSNTLPGVLSNNVDRINAYLERGILYLLDRIL